MGHVKVAVCVVTVASRRSLELLHVNSPPREKHLHKTKPALAAVQLPGT